MGIIAKPLSYLLIWLYELVGSYGIAILILTVVIKLCLYPLYAKQIKSTMRMTDVQPKVKEIQQKYAKDRELMNQKMMELYKDEGVSMYGGCLPMIVQMFIIMGLFALLRTPMSYLDTNMLFAIHEPFLWIKDLAQPDKWILPISAGAATFFSFSMNSSMASMGGGERAADCDDVQGHEILFPDYDFVVCKNLSCRLSIVLVRQPGNSNLLQYQIQ